MLPRKSEMMTVLFGENATSIYNKYDELNLNFNAISQQIEYDTFWRRSGLTLQEKNLITVISLVVLYKEETLRLHLLSFFHLGGSPLFLAQALRYLESRGYISSYKQAMSLLQDVMRENKMEMEETWSNTDDTPTLSNRHVDIIDFASRIALGDQDKTIVCLVQILKNKLLSLEDIENIMLHQIIYCGFPCAMNGFAVLRDIAPVDESQCKEVSEKSVMMDALYGKQQSETVLHRCQELSPQFNALVQRVVYDKFWGSTGLALKDKSLITIVTLLTLNKEEQLRIHLRGFFHLGGTPSTLLEAFTYLKGKGYISSLDRAIAILKSESSQLSQPGSNIIFDKNTVDTFTERDKAMASFSALIAIGNRSNINVFLTVEWDKPVLSEKELENIMLHIMLYCGFPCAINGFTELKSLSNNLEYRPIRSKE